MEADVQLAGRSRAVGRLAATPVAAVLVFAGQLQAGPDVWIAVGVHMLCDPIDACPTCL
jgi:hypothetical protein